MVKLTIGFHVGKNNIEFDNFKEAIEFSKELEAIISEGEKAINNKVKKLFDNWVLK